MNPNNSLQWGYPTASGNSTSSTWSSVPTRAVKRPMSESDDCDDVFSEGSSKEQCTSPGNAESCQMLSRKKRRGVIEKKRRDRINTSLTELKRLVPSAFEKQGSAKLEKAEILQMTVDHLKMIHAKGLDALAYDPHKFAMDYHNIGFRECATEVARYLVTIEGMDIQDPLRLRLMSHLQCFAAQRELASKQASTVSPWGYGTSSQNYPPPLNPIVPSSSSVPGSSHSSSGNLVSNMSSPVQQPLPLTLLNNPNVPDLNNHFDISTSCAQSTIVPTTSVGQLHTQPSSTSVLTPLSRATTTMPSTGFGYSHHQYPNLNAFPTTSSGNSNHHQNYNQGNSNSQMKPYRPWGGAEVAY